MLKHYTANDCTIHNDLLGKKKGFYAVKQNATLNTLTSIETRRDTEVNAPQRLRFPSTKQAAGVCSPPLQGLLFPWNNKQSAQRQLGAERANHRQCVQISEVV